MIEAGSKVLIIGGGIGGMAAAIALRARDVEVDLIEIGPEWKAYGAGLTITGPTLRAFRDLGLFDAIAEHGAFSGGSSMFLHDGTLLSESVNVPIEPGLPAAGAIMRPVLHDIMSEKVRNLGVDVSIGITAEDFQETDGGVNVTFSDGNVKPYAAVIASDGIYSQTRGMLFPGLGDPIYTGQMSWRVVGPWPSGMEHTHFFFGHEVVGGINPCSKDEVYAFVLHPMADPQPIPENEKVAYLRDIMSAFGGSMAEMREGIGSHSSIVQRPFEYYFKEGAWHKGRVVLMGDAVHATTPHLASGAGMAVEDGLVLAEELTRPGTSVPEALEAFYARRYERCKFVVDTSVGIAEVQLAGCSAEEVGKRMGMAMQRMAEPI